MPRVLLASLYQESCSFVPSRTDLEVFRRNFLYRGPQIVTELADTSFEVAGALHAAAALHIEVIPVLAAFGGTGGPLYDETFETLRDWILDGARCHQADLDGVLLSLHGAMVTERRDDPEGEILAALRRILGPTVPIVCSLDMHAHITAEMLRHATAVVGFRTHPHVDFAETGDRAMRLLARVIAGDSHPTTAHVKLQMIAPPESHNTSRPPMAPLMQAILEIERQPRVLAVSLFAPPVIDVPDLGWSIVVVSDADLETAQHYAATLADRAWQNRHLFQVRKTPIPEALDRARAHPGGPIIFADSSDSTSGGASGDSTWLLRELLASPVAGRALLMIVDPEAVAACIDVGVGSCIDLYVGGNLAPEFSQPVRVRGTVRTISDGVYQMRRPPMLARRGRTVVLESGDLSLVISEHPVFTWDEEFYRSVGLFPREVKVVQLKSPGGFRPIYEPFAAEIIEIDSPGPTDSDLRRLPFARVTRPLFPLDDI
jgi:microcystin degradation protein MlrC